MTARKYAPVCTYETCDRSHWSKGLCATHYQQQRRGEELHPPHSTRRKALTPEMIEARKEAAWGTEVFRRYGITAEEYRAKLAEQGNACAICRTTDPGRRRFSVDHDHSCCPGATSCGSCVRGLLCGSCNAGIALLGEDVDCIERAIAYLSTTRVRMWAV